MVFDASTPIAAFGMHRPDLIDRFKETGYEQVAPPYAEHEPTGAGVGTMIANLLERGTLRIADVNGRNGILRFMTRFQGIELGECDAILSCLKMRHQGEEARCVLDDKGARTAAEQAGIKYVGFVGLLGELSSTGIMTGSGMEGVVAALRKSNFRIKDSLLDGITKGV